MRNRRRLHLYGWYSLLVLLIVNIALLGITRYMATGYRQGVWNDFNQHAAEFRDVINVPYADLINRWSRQAGVNPAVVASVIRAESSFQPRALSKAGAYGLMQIIPDTWRYVNNKVRICADRHSGDCTTECYFTPELNIGIGAHYLAELNRRFKGDLVRAVAAYNAGPGAVDHYGGIPPYSETQDYVERVVVYWYEREKKTMPMIEEPARWWEQAHRYAWYLFDVTAAGIGCIGWRLYRLNRSWRWG